MSFLTFLNKENVLILNTPNRQEILKEGPPISQVKSNLLGRGAYGTVIKAVYKGKPVALKIIKNVKDVNSQVMLNESRILGWRHSNIVRILKIESTANFSLVIMERFDGQCLQSILNATEIALVHRAKIALDVISALSFCHKKGILHMDVKPQNIIIFVNKPGLNPSNSAGSYICKLCDFGSSISANDCKDNLKGLVKGTLRYMAPEALKEECLTQAADIYSLGITLWQMKYRLFPYFWLKCNEVVAYQVVKHNLRPNAIDRSKDNKSNANALEKLCECTPYAPQLSSQSLENLLNILNENECELIGPQLKSEIVHPSKKTPLKTLNVIRKNSSASVKRNLQCEFLMSEQCGALSSILQNCQAARHQQSMRADVVDAEHLYDDIYTSCWHSDYKQRPSTSALHKLFRKLL